MKKIGLLALFALLNFSTYAQKFGHLNAQELISIMPERDKAVEQLQDYAKGIDSGLIEVLIVGNNINRDYLDEISPKIEKKIKRKVSFFVSNKTLKQNSLTVFEA